MFCRRRRRVEAECSFIPFRRFLNTVQGYTLTAGVLAPVPPMSHINNYTITFNFPREVITLSSRCISITLSPLLTPVPNIFITPFPPLISSPSPPSHPSSFLHLSSAAQHHSRFILSASVSVFPSHSLVLSLICSVTLSLSLFLLLPSSCEMAGNSDVIYPTYCVAMVPLKPVALWVNIVPHDWRIHQ